MKIGRNDPCLCMSGNKFKKCCGVSGIWLGLKEQGLNYYDEEFALDLILKNSELFINFYANERLKVSKGILFVQTDEMHSAASFGSYGDLAYLIYSKNAQYPIEDAIHVAHEIEHLVLCSNGYKIVSFKEGLYNGKSRINRMINDLLYDPLINEKLHKYGFDVQSYLALADQIQIGINPLYYENDILIKTLVAKRYFDYNNLAANVDPSDIPFNEWVQKQHPDLFKEGVKIIELIESNSRNNPEDIEDTLTKLITYFGFENQLEIINF